MIILGISFLSDASACILKNGKVIAAISEERLNRVKLYNGIPKDSIKKVLEISNLEIKNIDYIATHCRIKKKNRGKYFENLINKINKSNISSKLKKIKIKYLNQRLKHENLVINKRTPAYLNELAKYKIPILNFEHHDCHASTAYYGSSFKNSLIITADGWGEDGSASIWNGVDGEMKLIKKSNSIDSLGYFYGSITKALGFIPHRHEGKVLGLAAYSNLNNSIKEIDAMINFDKKNKHFKADHVNSVYLPNFDNPFLKQLAKKYTREDISFSAQKTLEKSMLNLVSCFNKNRINISLSGGIFANVILNQKILETKNVNDIYVFPNMGDGGLSIGAAYLAHKKITGKRPISLKSPLLGPGLELDNITSKINKYKFKYKYIKNNPEKIVAELISKKNVVALVRSKMEFGPRALCNRSILASAEDHLINETLNKKLGRSEFMPFAPVSMENFSSKLYDIKGSQNKYSSMTITTKCKKLMRNLSPAAVHLDSTARPQLVNKKKHPFIFKILQEYYKITKIPSLINTSYNMHEEPIVCTVEDALRAFKSSKLDYLFIENYLIFKKK